MSNSSASYANDQKRRQCPLHHHQGQNEEEDKKELGAVVQTSEDSDGEEEDEEELETEDEVPTEAAEQDHEDNETSEDSDGEEEDEEELETEDEVPTEATEQDPEDNEINIYLKLVRTIAMKVKKSETVRNVKAMLNDKEGISECLQELFFAGDQLWDDSTLVDCGIQQNSTLNVYVQTSVPLRLNIKIPSRKKTIVVEAKTRDNVKNVKSLISAREGIHSDNFSLVYAGKQLEDDMTLASLGIQGESTIYMVLTPKQLLPISVKLPSGERLDTEVNILHTVCDVKTIIESTAGISLDDLSLTFNGMQLNDSQTLHYYNIPEKSLLEMASQTIQVFLRDLNGGTQTLEVCQQDLVKDVKDQILRKLGIPVHAQRLIFEGKCLCDNQNLAGYNIQKNCTLNLAIWTPSFVKRGKLSELGFSNRRLRSCRRISDLKSMIEDITGVPVKELCLGDGSVLDMNSFLSQYGIKIHTLLAIATETPLG